MAFPKLSPQKPVVDLTMIVQRLQEVKDAMHKYESTVYD